MFGFRFRFTIFGPLHVKTRTALQGVCAVKVHLRVTVFLQFLFALRLLMRFTRFTALRIKVQCRGFIKRTSRQSLLDQVQDLFTTEHTLTTVSWLVSRLAAPHARLRVAVGRE